MLQKSLLLISFLFFAYTTKAQINADSLRRVINKNKIDTNHAKALLKLSEFYSGRNVDTSIFYANRFLGLTPVVQKPAFLIHAHLILGYCWYMKPDYNKAIDAYKNMYTTAAAVGDKANMSIGLNNEGNVHIELGDYNTALQRYKESLAVEEEAKNGYGIARGYNNIGYVQKELGNYEKAVENFLFALQYYEKGGWQREAAMIYNNIASIYVRQKNFEKAIEYNSSALSIQSKGDFLTGKGISLQSLANIYAETKNYKKAVSYYRDALANYEQLKDKRQIALLYSNVGNMYNLEGKYDSSILSYDKAIALNREIGNGRNLASALLGNAASLIAANNFTRAKVLLDSAEASIKATNKKDDLKDYYLVRSNLYTAAENYKGSLEYFQKYVSQKDSLFNEQNTKVIADLNIKYETEKKKLQIEVLNKTNSIKDLEIKNQKLELTSRAYELAKQQLALTTVNLNLSNSELQVKSQQEVILKNRLDSADAEREIQALAQQSNIQRLELQNQKLLNARKNTLIAIIIVVALLSGLLAYSYYRRTKLKQAARLQASILQQQELATKAVLDAEEKERKRIAGDLHDGIGQMMSAAKMNLSAIESDVDPGATSEKMALQKVIALIDDSIKEVRSVSHSMMPNALLKAGLASAIREFIDQLDKRKIQIQLHSEGLNERIDQNIESVLYRVVQECVNNVIKHANASRLDISIIKGPTTIEATIEDNGAGFKIGESAKSEGIGLKNMRSRIEFLKGDIEWNSSPGMGTLVAFQVPI